ncbi:MAG: outer membrane protein [Methylocella sp.]
MSRNFLSRKFLLASAGAIALTGPALAADLRPLPPPPPVFTWTGIYLGGQIGYAWESGDLDFTGFDSFTGNAFNTSVFSSPNGVIGGAHVGYNYQINQCVVSLEGTVDGTSVTDSPQATFPIAFGGATISAHTYSDIQGSISARIGIAWDRVLFYGTGGLRSAASKPVTRPQAT